MLNLILYNLIAILVIYIYNLKPQYNTINNNQEKINKTKKMTKTRGSFKGKRLFKSKKNRMIAGVCGGIGEYFDVDPTLIRLLWALITLFSLGAGVIAYIIACIIIPEKP